MAIEGQMGLFDMDNNQTPKIDKKNKETVVKESKKTETNQETTYSNGNGDTPHKGLIYKSLEEVFHDAMIPYTEHVVMDRALNLDLNQISNTESQQELLVIVWVNIIHMAIAVFMMQW